ncbi:hypothetical protein VOLCADRAFT_91271 [Volvox carteri f. nagariensis]|uniref:Glycosyltransferase 2-like domain-containing protein n=1 Tax=Volvox carteri f. nagariensis TaxID=3068 RepID=D8TWL7_VOLCA|nr:uncharacterized protein VOLCADRAFT_91271 [Volvox carteri f. nagariensis]EFJ48071.1 hypothetical protein VOLCADRAFT_91271 [Volvox carteri f. nagariensis]|eukprot:XP_002950756.1 hypothetical protein VOLCADRAFT_91271 [Volvox carteri f. nagariensis]
MRGYILLFAFVLSVHAKLGNIFRLPFCENHLEQLNQDDILNIRDIHQQWLMHRRIEDDMTKLLGKMREYAIQQPTDAAEAAAWKTDWSEEYVSARLNTSLSAREHLEEAMRTLVGHLRARGRVKSFTTVHELVQCSSGHLNARLFPDRPEVSLMLQYFRRPTGIPAMINLLENCTRQMPVELLVNVDSPEEGQLWADLAWTTRGRLVPVFSNNIHEIRSYNRLAALARGKVLVVLQDDDGFEPADCSWIHRLVRQFDSMPKLGMVGLKSYRRGNGREGNLERWPDTFHHFSDPSTGNFFTFPLQVDYAPMALRRAALLHVGGVDEGMSDVGECGIVSDWELSIRMWTAGWHVGFMPLLRRVRVDDAEGTTHSPKNVMRCWDRQMWLGGLVYSARWGNGLERGPGAFLEELENEIRILNLKTLNRNYTKCPFRKGCQDLEGNPPLNREHQRFFSYNQRPMVDA